MSLHHTTQLILEVIMRRVVGRLHTWIVLASLLLTALGVYIMATQWNMNSNLNALLPDHSPAAIAMDAVSQRVGSGSSLFVVVDSPDQEANIKFARDYSSRLLEEPGVAMAHYHNDKSFFEKNKLLYVDEQDLARLYNETRDLIKERKKEANPLFVSLGPPKTSKKKEAQQRQKLMDIQSMQDKYESRMAHQDYKEYLFSDDGYALIIIVRFAESSMDMVATNTLITKVQDLANELEPTTYNPNMKIDFGGGLASRQKQYNSILDDIQSSAVFTLIGLLLILSLYFRRVRAILVVLTPLCMGVVWTLALALLLYNELNAITVFIFAILLGLGIDFSIHIVHGFDRARADGLEPVDALVECAQSTGKATILGASTTLATFLVLTMADFKSLSQFGAVASIGVVFTMIATLLTMPSIILILHRIRPLKAPTHAAENPKLKQRQKFYARMVHKIAPWSLLLTLSATIWASHGARKLRFEEDFYRIGTFYWPWEDRPDRNFMERTKEVRIRAQDIGKETVQKAKAIRQSIDPDTFVRERKQTTTGAKYSSALQNKMSSVPTILLFDDASRAEHAAYQARQEMATNDNAVIGSISSIYDFMPGTRAEQEARMIHIRALKELLDSEPRSLLKDSEKKRFDELRENLDIEPVTLHDLPDWTKRFFKESGPNAMPPQKGEEFSYEYMMMVTARQGSLNGPAARRFLRQLQTTVGTPEQQGYLLASQAYVYTTMLDQIQIDGLNMIMLALIVVMVMLAVAFRSPIKGIFAMTPLLIGAIWTFGVCQAFEIRLDFFNIIILPALIGIGVDDGIHFTMRYFELGKGSLGEVMQDVGSAVSMTSMTSLIGFGGLVVTNYKGLQSLGQLAIIGILFAWLATILVLPSLLWAREELLKSPMFAHFSDS